MAPRRMPPKRAIRDREAVTKAPLAGRLAATKPHSAKRSKKKAGSVDKSVASPANSTSQKSAVRSSGKRRAGCRATSNPSPLDHLRALCLALPEAHEVEAWGEPTFRVKGKIFAMHATASTHHGAGREAVWIAAHSATQDLVIRAKPRLYFSPPYVGPSGWIGAWLDKSPVWSEVTDFIRDAYRMKAPKKLAAQVSDD